MFTTKRRRSLLAQALMVNLALVASLVVCLAVLLLVNQRSAMREQLQARAALLADFLASESEFGLLVSDREELERLARSALANREALYVAVTGARGEKLIELRRPEYAGANIPARPAGPPGDLMMSARPGAPLHLDALRLVSTSTENELFDWKPRGQTARPLGTIRVGFSMAREQAVFSGAVRGVVAVAAFTLALVALVHYINLRRLLRPMESLIAFTRRVANGDLSGALPAARADELGDLTVAFNSMVQDLARSREELMRLVDRAQEASRLKSEFLANMSHEIRTPMNGIIGMAELALRSDSPREQREYLEAALEAATSLLSLINDILDFSKIEADRLDLDTQDFKLPETLSQAVRLLAPRAREKRLDLFCDIAEETPRRLAGDPVRLRQVIVNLAGNAVKFTDRGEICLSVAIESEAETEIELRFTVSDTGIGIPADKHRLIFEPFRQADGSSTRLYGGTGLGLAICARLVRLMGGRIWVESEPGLGSRFHFTARLKRSVRNGDGHAGEAAALRGRSALVVATHPMARKTIAAILTRAGMNAHAFPSIEEAKSAIERAEEPFSAAVLDACQACGDDACLCGALRAVLGGIPVVVLRPIDAKPKDGCGARYIAKPVAETDLVRAVLHLVAPPEPLLPAGPLAAARVRTKALHALVAEDNRVNQRVVSKTLEQRSWRVTCVQNGREAVEAAARERYDVILMDVQMPEMDGLEATAAIRERERDTGGHVPILALTAHAMIGDRERCIASGMDGYITKPVRPESLFDAIDGVLDLVPTT